MPTDWHWWAGVVGEWSYDLACETSSRDAAITEALRHASDGDIVQVVEAQMSTAAKYDGHDEIPFVRTRNREIVGVVRDGALEPLPPEMGL